MKLIALKYLVGSSLSFRLFFKGGMGPKELVRGRVFLHLHMAE